MGRGRLTVAAIMSAAVRPPWCLRCKAGWPDRTLDHRPDGGWSPPPPEDTLARHTRRSAVGPQPSPAVPSVQFGPAVLPRRGAAETGVRHQHQRHGYVMNLIAHLPHRAPAFALTLVLALAWVAPAAAADPAPSETPAAESEAPTPGATPESSSPTGTSTRATGASTGSPAPTLAIAQKAVAYDLNTNRRTVDVTLKPANQVAPWQYNVTVAGSLGRQRHDHGRHDRHPAELQLLGAEPGARGDPHRRRGQHGRRHCHAQPQQVSGDTSVLPARVGPDQGRAHLTEASFIARLRTVGSPGPARGVGHLPDADRGRHQPCVRPRHLPGREQLGQGRLRHDHEELGQHPLLQLGGSRSARVPYAPGNGYTYASYPTWLASVRAYVDLLGRYDANGYTTVSKASAHWLGTYEGSDRHMTYLRNITSTMSALPTTRCRR